MTTPLFSDPYPPSAEDSPVCPGCGARGFDQSVLGPTRCTFCDGTEGGNPPEAPAPEPPAPDPSDRETPQALYDALDARFGFCWDVAATAANCKVWLPGDASLETRGAYFGPDHPHEYYQNALEVDWREELSRRFCGTAASPYWLGRVFRPVVWCNPPWGRGEIADWCAHAANMTIPTGGPAPPVTTVMLLPADPSTRWFHDYVLPRRHYWQKGRNAYAGDAARLTAKGKLSKDKKGTVLVLFEPALPNLFAVHGR